MNIDINEIFNQMRGQSFNPSDFGIKFNKFQREFEKRVKEKQSNVEILYQQPAIQSFQSFYGGQPLSDVLIWNPSTNVESLWCIGYDSQGYWFVNVKG